MPVQLADPARVGRLSLPASCCLTTAATRPPSASPATFGFTIFMTAPMARGPSAPAALASSTACATICVAARRRVSCLRQVRVEDLALRLLPLGLLGTTALGEGLRGLAALLRLLGDHLLHLVVGELAGLVLPATSSLVMAVRVSRSVEERSSSRALMAVVEVFLQLGLERGHAVECRQVPRRCRPSVSRVCDDGPMRARYGVPLKGPPESRRSAPPVWPTPPASRPAPSACAG